MRVNVLNRAWLVATGLAAAVALPATNAMAQTPGTPSGNQPSAAPNQPLNPSAPADASRAEGLLRESRQAIDSKNAPLAVAKFREAAVASVGFPQLRGQLTDTARALIAGGVDPAQLQPQAIMDANAKKAQASRLVAEGRLALDRGDIATAVQMAREADSLRVPEEMFAAGEPRPWQLLLDAESAARRTTGPQPVMLATGANTGAGPVAQAGGGFPQLPPNAVQQVQATSGIAGGAGQALFNEGMQALADGDKVAARAKFVEAWQYEGEMTPETRRQLKDKLTLLQPETTVSGGASSAALDSVTAQQQAERQRLYQEVSAELAESQKIATTLPLDALDRIDRLRRRVTEAPADDVFKRQMLTIVDRARTEQQRYVDENRSTIELQLRNEQVEADLEGERAQRRATSEQIALLVEEFNTFMRDRRYHDAESVAKKVQLLSPDSEIAVQMVTQSRVALRGLMNEEIRAAKEEYYVDSMLDVERTATGPDPSLPMSFGEIRDWETISRRRLTGAASEIGLNAKEEMIRQKLFTSVDVRFPGIPLGEVLRTLGTVAGVPIYIDQQALSEARVNVDEQVTLDLAQPVMLRSALQLILERFDLTWAIEDEVLKITSKAKKRSNVHVFTYKVADLVTPIPNFVGGYEDGMAGAMRAAFQNTAMSTDVRVAPMSGFDIAAARQGQAQGQLNPNALAQYGSPMPFSPGSQVGPGGAGGAAIADFDSLIQLIQQTIAPDTWDATGGPSTISPYRANLTLVVSTTTDVHEQIADLLASLRRLQNLQVTIEVRFITLSDSFYERIGVDFDIAFDDNVLAIPSDDRGPSVTVGLAGENRLLTSDLDVQFNNGSFGPAVPTFGNFVAGQGGQIGFAILSDIEAFFFLEAAQGDSRSNVMQAPKVTMFDGQIANVSDQTQRPFVMGIVPVVGDFAVAQQPVIVVLNEGTQMNVQAVVSDDKRFVRLTLVPMFTQINDVDTFTYEGSRRTNSSRTQIDPTTGEVIEEDGGEDIIVGTTVQQPSFSFTSISTTVSVPDGGTILLGGIKRLRENRNEVGVPMLSKIPYVNRLFRNVGIGREATSLMMMVTPRIIIQEEEEIAQTGFDPSRP